MADNITNPNGDVIRTDEIGGVHWQSIKLAIGADGTATFIAAGSQADSASLPVAFSTEGKALLGTKTTSVTALESGGSGIIGWLSQAWRELAAIKTAAQSAVTSTASGQVAPTTSAGTVLSSRTGRRGAIVTNKGSVPVFIGAATVTTSAYRLDPGESVVWYSEELMQGITASGTGSIHYVDFY